MKAGYVDTLPQFVPVPGHHVMAPMPVSGIEERLEKGSSKSHGLSPWARGFYGAAALLGAFAVVGAPAYEGVRYLLSKDMTPQMYNQNVALEYAVSGIAACVTLAIGKIIDSRRRQ